MRKYFIPKWSREYLEESYKSMSLGQIAKEQNTYTNSIKRAMVYYGIPLKDKSTAQKEALSRGTSINPKEKKNDS